MPFFQYFLENRLTICQYLRKYVCLEDLFSSDEDISNILVIFELS